MRRLWGGLRWAAVFLAGGVVGGIVVGWFLREIGAYERDLFRLSTELWESEEAMDQYANGDPACAVAFLEHYASVLRFYVDSGTETILVPGREAYAVDLAVTYERLARLSEKNQNVEDAAAWREKAMTVVRAHDLLKDPSYEFLSSIVDRMDQHLDGDRTIEEFGFFTVPSGEPPTSGAVDRKAAVP